MLKSHIRKTTAFGQDEFFHFDESVREFLRCCGKCKLRIDTGFAGRIYTGKEQIADFFRNCRSIALFERIKNFVRLFVDFRQGVGSGDPIEPESEARF